MQGGDVERRCGVVFAPKKVSTPFSVLLLYLYSGDVSNNFFGCAALSIRQIAVHLLLLSALNIYINF